jgi:hypothetical protein
VTYTLLSTPGGLLVSRDADGAIIPADSANADRRAYEQWVANGNAPTPSPTPTLDEMKTQKLAALAERRWRAEGAGVTIGDIRVQSTREAWTPLARLYQRALSDPTFSCPAWKLGDGSFIAIDNATLIAMGDAVEAHVQACFLREKEISTLIAAAADAAALAAIDIESGWPA